MIKQQQTQDSVKVQIDKHRSERELSMTDWTFVKLQPYLPGISQSIPRYFGPFQVIQKEKSGPHSSLT